jgi:predicted naringenin-chalcone synthase
MNASFLSHFYSIRPRYELTQAKALNGLLQLRLQMKDRPTEWTSQFIERRLRHFGLANGQIETRGSEIADYTESRLELFQDGEVPSLETRMNFFKKRTSEVMSAFYETESEHPSHLVHVSCTGYTAPNAAQELAAKWKRELDQVMTVTNAYHMGCYAAFPAIRMAEGLSLRERNGNKKNSRVDVVHQELCSLHFDPLSLEPEQVVVQSLFADGHIRYSLTPELNDVGFQIKALREEVLPGTLEDMSWVPTSSHFAMRLSRAVPDQIKPALRKFVKNLLDEAGVSLSNDLIFAIHPGGPKIIEAVETELELSNDQTVESHAVLRRFGNMSSATLPHIWKAILESSLRRSDQHVVSLAFGPGLTLSGGVFKLCRT